MGMKMTCGCKSVSALPISVHYSRPLLLRCFPELQGNDALPTQAMLSLGRGMG